MFEILGITLHWYGLLIGLGVWLAIEIALKKKGDIDTRVLEKAMWWAVLAGVIGARAYHVVDFWSRYYSTNIYKILFFWEGGLGIWGAIGGGLLGLFIFCYFNKLKYWKTVDSLIVGVPLAQAVGRVGNYINGELVGKNGEPLFVYEGVLSLLLFGLLWKVSQKQTRIGLLSGLYFVGYGLIRVLLENLRPEETVWKIGSVPVAIVFGLLAVTVGSMLIFRKKQS
jgi:phosphatidylglycerol:prolipoprotein diacylglycerol transferase